MNGNEVWYKVNAGPPHLKNAMLFKIASSPAAAASLAVSFKEELEFILGKGVGVETWTE